MLNRYFHFRLIMTIAAILLFTAATTGCVSEPYRKADAIVVRDMTALESQGKDSPETRRAKALSQAKLEAHGGPNGTVLDALATQIAKDEETKTVAKEIVESAAPWKKWLGDWWGYAMAGGGFLLTAAGIGWKIYTGNWAGVLHSTTRILSEAVELFGNKDMKNWIEAAGANSKAEKKLEEFHQISKARINGYGKEPTTASSGDPSAVPAPT